LSKKPNRLTTEKIAAKMLANRNCAPTPNGMVKVVFIARSKASGIPMVKSKTMRKYRTNRVRRARRYLVRMPVFRFIACRSIPLRLTRHQQALAEAGQS
jgi:hypothetical protein